MATLFFVVSKLLAFLLQPATWLVLALLWAWRALRRDRPDRARRVLGGTLAVLLVLSVVPVGDMALRPLETAYPVRPALGAVDTIIVLGGGEDIDKTRATGLVQLGPGGERMTEAMALARAHSEARLLFTGANGSVRAWVAGETGQPVARIFYDQMGFPADRLTVEDGSRNTAENAAHSAALVDPSRPHVLVTSAFHMPRAMASFARAGFTDLTAWPTDHRADPLRLGWDLFGTLDKLHVALHEYVGRAVYALTGR